MSWLNRSMALSVCLAISACSSAPTSTLPANSAGNAGLIPATNVALSPTTTLPLEKLVYWGGLAVIAYYVLDPLAPNWEIREAKFPGEHYKLSLKMKRYYAGGAGESRMVFNRRAKDLANANGYSGYKILEYSEGLDSSIIGSQRIAEGVVVLTGSRIPSPQASSETQAAPVAVLPVAPAPSISSTTAQTAAPLKPSPLPQSKPKSKAKPKKRKDC